MVDNYGREIEYLRVSVTDLCNLRCRYCMGKEGIQKLSHDAMLTQEELLCAVKAAAACGIKKIRFTGGEPLVKKNILSICSQVSQIDEIKEICMTTNGTLLPEKAAALRQSGVSRLNISLDTLNAEKFSYMTRGGSLNQALAGIDAAFKAGFSKIKINAVLIKGFNDDEIRPLAELTLDTPADVRFIELMPMAGSGLSQDAYIPGFAVLKALPELEKTDIKDGVASLYRLPGAKGNIGLISPLSCSFCHECSRLRLTADGKIKPCLHSEREISVKSLSYEEMVSKFKEAVYAKPAHHDLSKFRSISRSGRSMNQIGG